MTATQDKPGKAAAPDHDEIHSQFTLQATGQGIISCQTMQGPRWLDKSGKPIGRISQLDVHLILLLRPSPRARLFFLLSPL
jgi:hypothetical protein